MAEPVISYEVASGWIGRLAKTYSQLEKKRRIELDQMGDLFGPPEEIAKYYIEPDCQRIHPADEAEDQAVSPLRSPVLKTITDFFNCDIISEQGARHLFVLSDAGMGKSALLMMLKLTHMGAFWPGDVGCELLAIGEDALERINAIEEKHRTVLLLDSLEGDPEASIDALERLIAILEATRDFRRVIVTCRTQFLPTIENVTLRPGYLEVEAYTCPSVYLSSFSDAQMDAYLAKRFPRTVWQFLSQADHPKHAGTKAVVERMRSLRCRPVLLSYVETLFDEDSPPCDTERDFYDVLIDRWLKKERSSARRRRGGVLTADELLEAVTLLARALQKSGLRVLPGSALSRLCRKSPALKKLELLPMSGRSLLNRTSAGEYRFAHNTIQEFLVAKSLSSNESPEEIEQLHITPFLGQMYVHRVNRHCENELVWIPGGEFQMGSSDERYESPGHEVLVTGVCMGRYPVTNAQYGRFLEDNPGVAEPAYWGERNFNQPRQPVVGVNWDDARAYCDWAGLRLPSEAEWEYACRAGTTTRYSSGDEEADLARVGWYSGNSGGELHQVGEKSPNRFGLYDMHGNVLEWVEDDWHGHYDGAPTDGSAWVDQNREGFRVYRGGSWDDDAWSCRSAYRNVVRPGHRYFILGFRVAKSIA